MTDRPISLVEEAYDVAIRFGELADTRLTARKLMANRRFLCASPAYLKAAGAPQTPADLDYLSRSNLPAKMRAFIDFVVADFGGTG